MVWCGMVCWLCFSEKRADILISVKEKLYSFVAELLPIVLGVLITLCVYDAQNHCIVL